jgi:three-Cys-motif partner protein
MSRKRHWMELLLSPCEGQVIIEDMPKPVPDEVLEDDGLPVREKTGPWAREKLGILRYYLPAFSQASGKYGANFVDGLAGPGVNLIKAEGSLRIPGSPLIALMTQPRFTRCLFLDLSRRNVRALAERIQPFGDRSRAVKGDVNQDMLPLMHQELEVWRPLLVFLDQEGFELHWPTVEALSRFRESKKGLKGELLILFNPDGVSREAGLWGREPHSEDHLNHLFPDDRWKPIITQRWRGELTPDEARTALIAAYAGALRELGYEVLNRDVKERGGYLGRLKYSLVFATRHPDGLKIMRQQFAKIFTVHQPSLPGFPEPPLSRDV